MYCAESMITLDADNWWLGSCGLSGGSSGGPWVQPLIGDDGPIISVNSWGYNGEPGMAGPKLSPTTASSASCLFDAANDITLRPVSNADGQQGIHLDCL